MLYPLTFHPIFKERVWGGRNLERLYHKALPPDVPIGESWEITDREEGISVINQGPLEGRTLRWLMENHARDLLGEAECERFPLLVKILDAQKTLSVQVHPPPSVAAKLGGEPKTEMWFVSDATPEAELFVGLKRGVTARSFEAAIEGGTVAECLHRIPVQAGDAIFLPSGRVHAIGGGNVIFEIQQNSDTTFRVFDWNRLGMDGRPRALHIRESLASIDFDDIEPDLIRSKYSRNPVIKTRYMLQDPLFGCDAWQVKRGQRFHISGPTMQVLGLVRGRLRVSSGEHVVNLVAGQFVLLPACLERVTLVAETQVEFLQVQK